MERGARRETERQEEIKAEFDRINEKRSTTPLYYYNFFSFKDALLKIENNDLDFNEEIFDIAMSTQIFKDSPTVSQNMLYHIKYQIPHIINDNITSIRAIYSNPNKLFIFHRGEQGKRILDVYNFEELEKNVNIFLESLDLIDCFNFDFENIITNDNFDYDENDVKTYISFNIDTIYPIDKYYDENYKYNDFHWNDNKYIFALFTNFFNEITKNNLIEEFEKLKEPRRISRNLEREDLIKYRLAHPDWEDEVPF
jgi:hypothetical protein